MSTFTPAASTTTTPLLPNGTEFAVSTTTNNDDVLQQLIASDSRFADAIPCSAREFYINLPFSMVVVGKPCSGKSTLVSNMLSTPSRYVVFPELNNCDNSIGAVYICTAITQDVHRNVMASYSDTVKKTIFNTFPYELFTSETFQNEHKNGKRSFIWLDDMDHNLQSAEACSTLKYLFDIAMHHLNLSIIFLVHSMHLPGRLGALLKHLRESSTYLAVFPSISHQRMLSAVAVQFLGVGKAQSLTKICNSCLKDGYRYVMLCLNTSDLRTFCRCGLTLQESPPCVYFMSNMI
uniref:ORC1/DEAH AAA+ ATPase domain-containing protein n=1 Tax=Plectus sambesii TaxID=2011161 RepID=A0A914UI73_9BILA